MRVYATLVASDDYAPGALVLAQSLQLVSSQYPLVCLCTPNLAQSTIDRLQAAAFALHFVPALDSYDPYHLGLLGRPELGITLTKLHLWTLVEYSRIVYLDADVLIRANIDHLFDRQEDFLASPDCGWPDCFNSGLFVFTPSLTHHENLLRLLHTSGSFDGGDQGLLNDYFPHWTRLSFTYNVTPTAFYSYLPAYEARKTDIKAVHFIGSNKPWNWSLDDSGQAYHPYYNSTDNSNLKEAVQSWWDVYNLYKQDYGSGSGSGSMEESTASFALDSDTNERLMNYRADWSAEQFKSAGSHYILPTSPIIASSSPATTATVMKKRDLLEEPSSTGWFQVFDTTPDLESVQISALSPVTKHANTLNMSEFFRLYPKASEYNDNAWRQRPNVKKPPANLDEKTEEEEVKLPPPMMVTENKSIPTTVNTEQQQFKREEGDKGGEGKAGVLGQQEKDNLDVLLTTATSHLHATSPRSSNAMVTIKEAPWINDVSLPRSLETAKVEEAGKKNIEIIAKDSSSFNDDLWKKRHHSSFNSSKKLGEIPKNWMEWTWQLLQDINLHCPCARITRWERELEMIKKYGFPRGVIMYRSTSPV